MSVSMKSIYRFYLLFVAALLAGSAAAQDYFSNFPVGADPKIVGKRVSSRLMETKHQLYGDRGIHYAEVCTWYGALRFAEMTNDKELTPYADTQWTLPEKANDEERKWHKKGYSWQTRLWIDDMYMITIVQAEAYHVTGDRKYINRAAKEMVLYLNEIQRENGLFYHAPDVPYYWGRGDGWMAVGMTELLFNLPENDPNRQRILKGYRLMMENLKKYVNQDGLWNQLIDEKDCWTETSGSAMFTYAMILGVKNGWLDKDEYGPVARRAWMNLCNYLDDNNDLMEVCIGTGKKNSHQYYLDRPRITGDYHGQAPIIWCAYALLSE